MIDATHLKAHRTAASLLENGLFPAVSGAPEAAWTPSSTPSQQPLPPSPHHPRQRALQNRQRHRIGNMFGRLKDWRRIAMRYDRCAHTFMSAICLAPTILFWINES